MRRNPWVFLSDVKDAADAIARFVGSRDEEAYFADEMLRAAVERQFEIIGEALNRLMRLSPELASRIPSIGEAIAFRNVLIHGYAQIDHQSVWMTINDDLPKLRAHVAALLPDPEQPS